MNDDLNVPEALSHVFNMMNIFNREIDKKKADRKSLKSAYLFFKDINKILDIVEEKQGLTDIEKKLIAKRESLRAEKKFKEADQVRSKLESMGIIIEDTPKGTKWKRK